MGFVFSVVQGHIFLLRGPRRRDREEQDTVPGAERQREPVGEPQVQFRQLGPSAHVTFRTVLQRRLGQHHVSGSGRSRTRSTGKVHHGKVVQYLKSLFLFLTTSLNSTQQAIAVSC